MSNIITQHLLITTPFLEYCDGNRLQMAASQCRQALPLKYQEPAYCITGYEKSWNPRKRRAKKSGYIVYVSSKSVLVKYIDNTYDLIVLTDFDEVHVQQGQAVQEGDLIVAPRNYFIDEELAQGTNLLVCIISDLDNFEDAFVVSESAAKKLTAYEVNHTEVDIYNNKILLSIDDKKIKLLPEIGDTIQKGKPIIKYAVYNLLGITSKPNEIIAKFDATILDITIKPNKFNPYNKQFSLYIETYMEDLREEILLLDVPDNIKEKLISLHSAYPLTYAHQDVQQGSINISIKYMYELPLMEGDKLTNRHAAKGVVSVIKPDKFMPYSLSFGEYTQILLNPMSIPSRMNVSQLYEMAATKALHFFKQKLYNMIEKDFDINDIRKFVLTFYGYMCEKNADLYHRIETEVNSIQNKEDFLMIDWRFVAPAFKSCSDKALENMLEMVCDPVYVYTKYEKLHYNEDFSNYLIPLQDEEKDLAIKFVSKFTKLKKKDIDINHVYRLSPFVDLVYIKENDMWYIANVGYQYYYRLYHLAYKKLSARSFEYYDLSGQPLTKPGHTPQRFGEMESWTLIAYDSIPILKEYFNEKSDDLKGKLELIYKLLTSGDNIKIKQSGKPAQEVLQLLKAYMYSIGLSLEIETEDKTNLDLLKVTIEAKELLQDNNGEIQHITERKQGEVT